MKKSILSLLTITALTACSSPMNLSVNEALNSNVAKEHLDSDVKLTFGPKQTNGKSFKNIKTQRSTMILPLYRNDKQACQRALVSALKVLQKSALNEGAHEVANIHTFYNNIPFESRNEFQCKTNKYFTSSITLKGTIIK